jgi:hypothetical protein
VMMFTFVNIITRSVDTSNLPILTTSLCPTAGGLTTRLRFSEPGHGALYHAVE